MSTDNLTLSQIIQQIDKIKVDTKNNGWYQVNQGIQPAFIAYVTHGNSPSDVSNFNSALLYAIHTKWPTPYTGKLDDKAPARAYADDLYRRTKDDHDVAGLKADVQSWFSTGANKSQAIPSGNPLSDVTGVVTALPDAVQNIGNVLGSFFDIIRWFTSPENLWRVAKFFLGAVMIYFGGTTLIKGTPLGKNVMNTASTVGKLAAI
jgi:hypothetical protein